MSRRQKLVLGIVLLLVAAAAWAGGDALWRLVRLMHGGH